MDEPFSALDEQQLRAGGGANGPDAMMTHVTGRVSWRTCARGFWPTRVAKKLKLQERRAVIAIPA
jgi:hypothetical protein